MYTQTLEPLIQRNEQHLGMYCSVSFHWNGHDLSLGFPLQTKKVKAPTFLLSLRLSQEKKTLIIYLDIAVCQHYADNRSLNDGYDLFDAEMAIIAILFIFNTIGALMLLLMRGGLHLNIVYMFCFL